MKRSAVFQRAPDRAGATTVEFAVVIPILILFTFSALEFSRANMLRNSIENAAFEGARRGIVPGANAANAKQAAQDLIDILRIKDSTIVITPSIINQNTEEVTVTVTAPMSVANNYITPQFFLGKTLTASVTLSCER